jgi:lysophospholipase L1-like esterase
MAGSTGGESGRDRGRSRENSAARRGATSSRVAPARRSGTRDLSTSAKAGASTVSRAGDDSRQTEVLNEVDGAPTDRRRRASAGRIIAVGLICFGLWLVLDANQLYRSAEAGQIGIRRTVAVTILRPIAALTNALHISGPVNAANTALGRCGAVGGSVCTSGSTVPVVIVGPPQPPDYLYRGHLWSGRYYVAPVEPTRPPGPPPIVPPTAARPLTLLSIGDSIGEDLGFGLGDVFSTDSAVRVIQKGVESTGLSRADYYNWPATLEADLAHYHPAIVVVMLGANDAQAFYQNGNYISFDTKPWWNAYAARVALVMSEATTAGAHVMWVGLPPMGSGSTVPAGFPRRVNEVFARAAATHPGVTYFPAARVLSSKSGRFTQYLLIGGTLQQIRYADGVHLAPAGYDLLARSLIEPMEKAWDVNLRVSP